MAWQEDSTGRRSGLQWRAHLQTKTEPGTEGGPRTDPYLVWFDLIDFAGFQMEDGEPLLLLIELRKPYADQFAKFAGIEVPQVYRTPLGPDGPASRFITARLPPKLLGDLLKLPSIARVQVEMARVTLHKGDAHPSASKGRGASPDTSATWIGIIDDSCPFLHPAFRETSDNASRVRYLWQQSGERALVPAPWRTCERLGYGRELQPSRLTPADDASVIDEATAYGQLDYGEFVAARARHGAGVMDLAAGFPAPLTAQFEPNDGARPDIAATLPMVFVQLPSIERRDTSSSSLGANVLDGLRYMIDRVETHGRGPEDRDPHARLVVNLSYGSLAGPHDGSTILEQAMDELIEQRSNLAIVLAAGNTHTPEAPTHACAHISAGHAGHLTWRVQPDDTTDSFLELWFDAVGAKQKVSIEVTAPGGVVQAVEPGHSWVLDVDGRSVAGLIFPRQVANGLNGTMALLALRPSVGEDGAPCAPTGDWQIAVRCTNPSEAFDVHAWIERDDLVAGSLRRRQQSHFVDTGGADVDVKYSLSSLAHGRHTIVAGAYRLGDGSVADYSASGPARAPALRQRPDVMAPGDGGIAIKGLRVAGTSAGVVNMFSGTSAAAPTVARWMANWMASAAGDVTLQRQKAALAACRNTMANSDELRVGEVLIDADLRPSLGGAIPSTNAAAAPVGLPNPSPFR